MAINPNQFRTTFPPKKLTRRLSLILLLAACNSCNDNASIDNVQRINNLEGLDAIKTECLLYQTELERQRDPDIRLGHDKSIAPEYYRIIIYPGLDSETLNNIESKYGLQIPILYKNFLRQINGAYTGDIALYGFPSTWMNDQLMNRRVTEPLNLYDATNDWINEVDIEPGYFLFGGGKYNDSQNCKYLIKDDKVYACLDDGRRLNEWSSINDMLEDELERLDRRQKQMQLRRKLMEDE